MSLIQRVSPVLDVGSVALESAGLRTLVIPTGTYPTPFWVRDGGTRVHRVSALPWQGTVLGSGLEVFSSDPTASVVLPGWSEEWAYADTAALKAGVREVWANGAPASGDVSLLTGLVNTPWGGDRCLRNTYLAAGSSRDHTVGVTLTMGSWADTVQPREIWFETWCRWSANWQSNGPFDGGGPGQKHFFLFDQREIGDARHNLLTQIGGTSIQMIVAGSPGTGGLPTPYPGGITDALFDGQWHLLRIHAAMHNTDGIWEATIDGNYFSWGFGGDNNLDPTYYYKILALQRNVNNGVFQDQTCDWGPVRAWSVDPGFASLPAAA